VLRSVRIRGLSSWATAVLAVVVVGVGWVAAICGVASGAELRWYELVSPSDKGRRRGHAVLAAYAGGAK
jgi:hypothetical protein